MLIKPRVRLSKKQRKHIKNILMSTQKGKCYLCGCELSLIGSLNKPFPTIDHIYPRKLGGNNYSDNLALACSNCNGLKGNRHPYPCEILYGRSNSLFIHKFSRALKKYSTKRF